MSELDKAPLLKEKIEVLSGFAFPSSGFNQLVGLPLIRIRDLGGSSTEVRFRGMYDPAYRVSKGDLLVGMDGDFEVHRWAGEDALLNQRVCKISSTSKEIHQSFLYWYLKPKIAEIHRRTPQTTVRHLSTKDIYAIEEPPFDFPTQERIAQILNTLDTAIRETETLIDKLKAVTQGLLQDLLARGIDSNGQLRPPQSQAPELYKESPLGWIPREWNWDILGRWLTGKPKNGYSPKEAGEWTGIQMLGLGCLTKEGFSPTQLKPAPAADKGLDRARLNEGDLLVSRANTRQLVGLVGVYRDVGTPCTYPDLMMRLLPSEETTAEFLELVLQSSKVRRQVQAAASGTSESMVKISSSIVTSLKVAIPKTNEQKVILCRTKTLNAQLQSELQGLEVLRAVKVGLMDDLLSGRVRVTPLLESMQQAAAQTEA